MTAQENIHNWEVTCLDAINTINATLIVMQTQHAAMINNVDFTDEDRAAISAAIDNIANQVSTI